MKVGVADLKLIADLRARVHQKSNRARASCVIDISDRHISHFSAAA
jgi:hypothetical protein